MNAAGPATAKEGVIRKPGFVAPTAGRRILLAACLAAPFIRSARAEPVRLRVTLDTAPSHGRSVAIADFLRKLEAASQGEIAPQLFDNGRLYADRDVIRALVLGQVEMAVPGTWFVSGYVPEAEMAQLPLFYGQPAETTHRAIDGIPGEMVNEQISRKLRVKILGRWLDLGFNNWYSARKPIGALADLKGLKVRHAGGFAMSWRTQFFGAIPNETAWPDVPLALSQGTFDALQTTNESCASARLWDAGLHFGLIDHQSMANYIPMLSESFWAALSPSLRTLMTDLWAANIGAYRLDLAAAQERAEKDLKARGVKLVYVSADDLADYRKRMLAEQDKIVHDMKMSTEVVDRISEAAAIVD